MSRISIPMEEEEKVCPLGLCDGSGWIEEEITADNIKEKRCLCNPKVEGEDMDDDS